MKKINICIIGAGNISNTRHIPAAKKNKHVLINGIIGVNEANVYSTAKINRVEHTLILSNDSSFHQQLAQCDWFNNDIDAVIIGTPPHTHFSLTQACLELNKHVLVEKPMMMRVKECEIVKKISEERHLVLNVMHNFWYADKMAKLEKRLSQSKYGKVTSAALIQISNRSRRLPSWYQELPLGLFFDEAAHFFYTASNLFGSVEISNVFTTRSVIEGETPRTISAELIAGCTPVHMYINFDAPVCEWYLDIFTEKYFVSYDFFKDLLIEIKNDGLHLSKDVLRNSVKYTFAYWKGFIFNGFKMILGNLLYGHDVVIKHYIDAIMLGKVEDPISADQGENVIRAMNEIVNLAKENK